MSYPGYRDARPLKGTPPMKFPVVEQIGKLFRHFKRGEKRVVLEAPTGSGKTLGIPPELARRSSRVRVRISVPTVVAARNAYSFIKRRTNVTCGYAAGRVSRYSPTDQIVYMTTGYLVSRIQDLIRRGILYQGVDDQQIIRRTFGDFLMIDEVHTSSIWISTLLGLLRYLFGDRGGPTIIFSSATTEVEDLQRNFPGTNLQRITVRTHPVDVIYAKRNYSNQRRIEEKVAAIVRDELTNRGSSVGIIFRPGKSEVNSMISKLRKSLPFEDVDYIPAYSGVPENIDEAITSTSTGGRKKIVVGTNYIESSVTVPDVDFVVTDVLEKRLEDAQGEEALLTREVSQNSIIQRIGRAGRTKPGRAYILMTKREFEEGLRRQRRREIDIAPIGDILMSMVGTGINIRQITGISEEKYIDTERDLIERGMLSPDGDSLTPLGEFSSELRMSPDYSSMVYLSLSRSEDGDDTPLHHARQISVIALACLLEERRGGYWVEPVREPQEEEEDYQARRDIAIEKYSPLERDNEVATLLNVFWKYAVFARDMGDVYEATREWSLSASLNEKKWLAMLRLFSSMESLCARRFRSIVKGKWGDFTPNEDQFQSILDETIYPLFREVFARNMMMKKRAGVYELGDKQYKAKSRLPVIYPAVLAVTDNGRFAQVFIGE